MALLAGIIEGPEAGWASVPVLGASGAAIALFAVFVAHRLRARTPLLDPRLFASARLRPGTPGVAMTFFGLFALQRPLPAGGRGIRAVAAVVPAGGPLTGWWLRAGGRGSA